MKQTQFQFVELSSCDSFENFARILGTNVINNTIIVPRDLGDGSIKKIQLAKGLQVMAWDIHLFESFELIKLSSTYDEARVCSLSYIFSPAHFCVESPSLNQELKLTNAMNLMFDSGNHDTKFTILPNQHVKALVLSMNKKWMEQEFIGGNIAFQNSLHSLTQDSKPVLFHNTVSPADYRLLSELHMHFMTSVHDPFYIKGNILLLLSHFLNGLLRTEQRDAGSNILHYDKIKRVEMILSEHLNANLPPLSAIAKEVALSESTLKRYFKMIFNTSIYDYYLQKKMEHAKALLTDKQLPVKEVAFMMGYENSSSFIRIFKKFYALPPGFLKEEHLEQQRLRNPAA